MDVSVKIDNCKLVGPGMDIEKETQTCLPAQVCVCMQRGFDKVEAKHKYFRILYIYIRIRKSN